jgi:hypothetical protein
MFADGEKHLSDWMHRHVSISWVDLPSPRSLEEELISALDLPLNLEGNSRNAFHKTLTAVRAAAMAQARRRR